MTKKERFELKNMIFDGLSIADKINGGYYTADEQDLENICKILNELYEENVELKQEEKKIINTINNKITKLGMDWYGAEEGSKEEKESNLQLNVLEEIREELKEI